MPDFQKKTKNPYRRFFINVGALMVVALVVVMVIADVKVYQKHRELNAQVLGLKQKVQDLKSENAQLKEGMARQDDPAYIEKVAREELDLQLPGEKVFSFVRTSGQQQSDASIQNNVGAWVGNAWHSFIGIFKK